VRTPDARGRAPLRRARCTGSACLAIAAAHTFPDAEVDAVDLSADALKVAQLNIHDHGLRDRVEVLHGDLFEPLEGRRYDLILSNPPYVTDAAMDALPEEFRKEPAMALGAGVDGMDIVRRIVAEAGRHLNPGGLLLVEIGHNQAEAEAALPDLPLVWLDTDSATAPVFLPKRTTSPHQGWTALRTAPRRRAPAGAGARPRCGRACRSACSCSWCRSA